MKARIPEGTRSERVAFMHRWVRERHADDPGMRLTRGRRRAIVVALYLLLIATVSALAGGPGNMPSALGAGPVAYLIWLFTGQFCCFMLVNYSVRGLMMAPEYLDERERELRDRATAVAYRFLNGVIAVFGVYVFAAFAFKVGLPVPTTAKDLIVLLIPLGWIGMSLPQSVLAWTLPDPEPLAATPASGV